MPLAPSLLDGLRFILEPFGNRVVVCVGDNKVEEKAPEEVLGNASHLFLLFASTEKRSSAVAVLLASFISTLPSPIKEKTSTLLVSFDKTPGEATAFCLTYKLPSLPLNGLAARKVHFAFVTFSLVAL